jgi:lactate dehydrogenase-like 2-hydroxyacid dehydrogenase
MSQIELMVTSDLPSALVAGLQQHFTVHHREHIRDASVLGRIRALVCPEGTAVGRDIIGLLPQLRMIAVMGANTQGIDAQETQRRAIVVVPTADVAADDVADFALGLLIGLVRRIPMADQYVRAGDWVDGPYPVTQRVGSLRLGLLGLGAAGLALMRRARACGMTVAYAAASADADVPATHHATTLSLAQQVDVLVVLNAQDAQACGRIDAAVLQALGAKGYVLNLVKGPVMDEAQVAQAIQAKQLAGAASDGHPEAPRVSAPLRQARPVIVTPAMAAQTQQATEQAVRELVANVNRFFDGQ